MRRFILIFALFTSSLAHARAMKVAAAADLKFVMQKLILSYQAEHKAAAFSENYGSSGNFVAQIKNGADFDIFFSADSNYAGEIVSAGLAQGTSQPYAQGVLDLCGAENIRDLNSDKYQKISLANPAHAPYGRIAVEALKNAQIYDQVKNKLVFGENVSQAAQFLETKAASSGFIAASLATKINSLHCAEIDAKLYTPLVQAFVILKKSKNEDVQKFAQFILSEKAQNILRANGFRSVHQK